MITEIYEIIQTLTYENMVLSMLCLPILLLIYAILYFKDNK